LFDVRPRTICSLCNNEQETELSGSSREEVAARGQEESQKGFEEEGFEKEGFKEAQEHPPAPSLSAGVLSFRVGCHG
jgi:hypothetical protein